MSPVTQIRAFQSPDSNPGPKNIAVNFKKTFLIWWLARATVPFIFYWPGSLFFLLFFDAGHCSFNCLVTRVTFPFLVHWSESLFISWLIGRQVTGPFIVDWPVSLYFRCWLIRVTVHFVLYLPWSLFLSLFIDPGHCSFCCLLTRVTYCSFHCGSAQVTVPLVWYPLFVNWPGSLFFSLLIDPGHCS